MENVEERGINCEGAANWGNYRLYENEIAAPDYCINLEASTATTYIDIGSNSLTLSAPAADEEFYNRAALRVFNIGAPVISNTSEGPVVDPLDLPIASINGHTAAPTEGEYGITIRGYGDGIVLENMSSIEIQDNEVVYENPSDEANYSHGIRLDDSAENYLANNTVEVGEGTNMLKVRNIYLSGSPLNELSCNSTNGGEVGLGFLGICNDTDLKMTIIRSHHTGLLCGIGTNIGIQEHQGNTWLTAENYGDKAAKHQGQLFNINQSNFRVKESPDTDAWDGSFWPDPESISTPFAMDAQWFREAEVSSVACEEGDGNGPIPGGEVPTSSSEIDRKIAEGGYATGNYATVHKWEAEKRLFARLAKDETMRNSEEWFRDFYEQADTEAVGDYAKVDEQFKDLLQVSSTERQQAEDLQISIQDDLKTLANIEESYSQATTEAESTALEADLLEQYTQLNTRFSEWQQLAADVRQRTQDNMATLRANNAALPADILPAANEKLMNTIQLKRIAGEPLREEERNQMTSLAFACPLEAGNAVYRARSVLRTWGNYVFDDTANCDSGKEDDDKGDGDGRKNKTQDNETTIPASQWRIYPNPAQQQLWVAGDQLTELESIQFFNAFGQSVRYQNNTADARMEVSLPSELKAGIYFLRLQLRNGEIYTQKILIQP